MSRIELVSVRLLLFLALVVAGFLAWNSFSAGGVPGCGPDSDCDKVLGSRWAFVVGVPVSLFAVPVYLAGLGMTFRKKLPAVPLLVVAMVLLMAAAWFVGLQIFVVRAFCKFCMAAHVAGVIAAVILLRGSALPKEEWVRPAAITTALGALLVLGQVASPQPAPVQVSIETNQISNSSGGERAAALSGQGPTSNTNAAWNPAAEAAPTLSIVRGQFTLDLTKVPVSGPLDAPKKMVKLFDYTCHHCRDLHLLLEPIRRRYASELAIVSLPMPLDAKCNPTMRSTPSAHENACEYARLALAVYFADATKFEEYSNWLFAPQRPPEVDSARAHAAELVGKERLIAMLADPRVENQINLDVQIYTASSRLGRSGSMPQMIFPLGVSIGAVANLQQLERILFDALGLGGPNAGVQIQPN